MPVGNVMRDVVSETMRNDVRCVRDRVSAWVIGKNTKLDPPPSPSMRKFYGNNIS